MPTELQLLAAAVRRDLTELGIDVLADKLQDLGRDWEAAGLRWRGKRWANITKFAALQVRHLTPVEDFGNEAWSFDEHWNPVGPPPSVVAWWRGVVLSYPQTPEAVRDEANYEMAIYIHERFEKDAQ